MWHDLGLYGDIAEAYMEALVDRYKVDLTGFKFDEFFPPEFVGPNPLIANLILMVPFAGYFMRKRSKYSPLTLGMIETAIRTRQWQTAEAE